MEAGLKLYKSAEGRDALRAWYDGLLAEIEIEVESLYVGTRFGQTHVLAAGPVAGIPVVLLHGLTGSAPLWRYQLRDLGRAFRVYALDTPGQPGRSDPNPPSILTDDYLLWLVGVLDGIGIDAAHFAGVSSGGSVIMQLGIRFPGRVRKIVMISPTGLSRMRLPVKIWLQSLLFRARDIDVLEDSLTARSLHPSRRGQTRDRQLARLMVLASKHYRVDRSLGIYDREAGRLDPWGAIKVLRKFMFAESASTLRRCHVPALLVLGEQELFYNPHKVARRALALMPDLRVEIVPDASHGVISDRPDYLNPVLIEFFGS
jgi:pimeloyl-ACP methyl ester carboxylesterase